LPAIYRRRAAWASAFVFRAPSSRKKKLQLNFFLKVAAYIRFNLGIGGHMKAFMLIFLGAGVFYVSAAFARDNTSADLVTRVDHYLSEGVNQGFSGSVLIARKGQIILNKGYGYADKERELQCGPDTVFTVGSVTKQFTATAILKLVEQGKLSVTDQLQKFFPDLPEDKQQITIHQLLIHAAGFPGGIGLGDFDPISREDFFKRVFAETLLHAPGEKHYYSNLGYSILGRIVELVSNQDYESFLRRHLFLPAGMTQTGYLLPQWESNNLAKGYLRGVVDLGTLVERFNKNKEVYWALKANGGIHSTINDMYKWYLALKNHTVLSPELTKILTTAYIPEDEEGSSHYAYGWAIFQSSRNTKIVSHNGGNGVFFFDFIWFPEEDALVLLANNGVTRETEVAWPMARMLFDADYQPKPIEKNAEAYVFAFMQQNRPEQLPDLATPLRERYPKAFSHPRTLNRLGYMTLRFLEDPAWAVALFTLNTDLFPENGNVWDSLGEGLLANNQKPEAIEAYRKAVALGNESSKKILEKIKP
jgi:CubicO group peptidase (beta-lactamase class C family)